MNNITKNNKRLYSNSVTRRLYSSSGCRANCKYCFAKWDDSYVSQPSLQRETIEDDISVVYPCCDGDIFRDEEDLSSLWKMVKDLDRIYISMSTKCNISDSVMRSLVDLNNYLIGNDKGFVKLSVSITTKTMIEQLEENSLSYFQRLELLRTIADLGFFVSVTLKPILPFIPNEEYFEIIDDCSSIVDRILVGGLYVDKKTPFYHDYILNRFDTTKRDVLWLQELPVWDYVVQDEKIKQIYTYALSKNVYVFDTDVDAIKSFMTDAETKVS